MFDNVNQLVANAESWLIMADKLLSNVQLSSSAIFQQASR